MFNRKTDSHILKHFETFGFSLDLHQIRWLYMIKQTDFFCICTVLKLLKMYLFNAKWSKRIDYCYLLRTFVLSLVTEEICIKEPSEFQWLCIVSWLTQQDEGDTDHRFVPGGSSGKSNLTTNYHTPGHITGLHKVAENDNDGNIGIRGCTTWNHTKTIRCYPSEHWTQGLSHLI